MKTIHAHIRPFTHAWSETPQGSARGRVAFQLCESHPSHADALRVYLSHQYIDRRISGTVARWSRL